MTEIEKQVMASVRVVYTIRILCSATALKVYALAAFVCALAVLVSVPHVTANFMAAWSGDWHTVVTYLLTAVLQTKLMVQVTLCAALCSAASLAFEMMQPHRQWVTA